MASLKDCLRNFAKAGSGFAFPSESCIVVESFTSTSTEGERTYVAPSNGFCVIWLNGTNTSAELRKDGGAQALSTNNFATWAKASIPCTRGQMISYAPWGTITQGEFYFVSSLGSQ